jgi:uncharacterized membrane protein
MLGNQGISNSLLVIYMMLSLHFKRDSIQATSLMEIVKL